MNDLSQYIIEKLHLNKDIKVHKYNYHPKDKQELKDLLLKLYKERGDNADLNDIDVSKITNMSFLFSMSNASMPMWQSVDVSDWDVSNVTNMEDMFYGVDCLNCDFSNWDVSNVTDMKYMFGSCHNFEGKGLENWDVSNVTDMGYMFNYCKKFNCNISNWNVDNVTNMECMFNGCEKFTQDLSNWNVSTRVKIKNIFGNGCPAKKPRWALL